MYLSINRKTRSFFHFYIKKFFASEKMITLFLNRSVSGLKGAKRSRRERAGIREPVNTRLEAQVKKYILFSECFGERHAQKYKNPI
ncbi:hypothetical protein LEP1GSC188_2314 [Leptospira weilii serovar Topaz str. LT2116]|uniref:Uncharacterized protein n=1 Tax=Leptospira weilii serovar Topaz str. LT2116 TaxID=1088540 RepID=M3EKW2_9LEPT|nr:hypothetical protein LEP1GSC188_2314 [Leptospira weilii serovar Topaz str. LT2116]